MGDVYQEKLEKIICFTNIYGELINCHLVDFITDDLWNTCLPKQLRMEFENDESDCEHWANDNRPVLSNLVKLIKLLSLESCSLEIGSKSFASIFPNVDNWNQCEKKNRKTECMNAKKLHEVELLGNIVGTIAVETNSLVIDAGAGKAYLSTFLAENHNVPVLAIDASSSCGNGAICRQKKLQGNNTLNLMRYVVEEINKETDYVKILNGTFQDWCINKNLILTGLHTCGSLTHSVIRTFLATKDVQVLCIVPCCYHLTNETFNKGLSFSKNARMLAQQSVERSMKSQCVPTSLFFRAVLQVILHSLGIHNARVGRGGPTDEFGSYAEWALAKIGVEQQMIPSREELTSTFQSYTHLTKRFNVFQTLRIHMAPVLEAAIMLDRVTFLQTSNQCSKLAITRLFDPTLSPRRFGIIALK